MSLDLDLDLGEAKDRINAYKTVSDIYKNEKLRKKIAETGDSLTELNKRTKQSLNELGSGIANSVEDSELIGDTKESINRVKEGVKNQYEELIEMFMSTVPTSPTTGSNSIDFLIRQVLGAARNTKSRISEIVVDEIIKTAGCSEEQLFEGNVPGANGGSGGDNKIYVRVNQVDLFKILDKDPEEGFNDLLFETENRSNGTNPYPMNKELFKRIQTVNSSFYDEFNEDYIGESGNQIMNIRYVTSYTENNITHNGDFFEVTLTNRPTLNNLSDFLRDYYKSIDILEFDTLGTKIMNSLTDIIDLSVGLTSSQKTEQNKFEKIIQRILGLCFDGRREIDVSGSSKIPVLDNLDESFFEMSNMDLRNIENDVNNFLDGVTEFDGCDGIKLPNTVELQCEKLRELRQVGDNEKIDALIDIVESLPSQENWKLFLPDGLNIDLSVKTGLLKVIPRAVVTTILSPKTLLGLMIALKSIGSLTVDLIEDFKTFTENMKEFMVNLISKISAIFVEELFKLLKKNIRKLVELLMLEIIRESKDARTKMIVSIVFVLLQLANAALDWRECKSVVDEIINLLSLVMTLAGSGGRVPSFTLASSGLLGGYSPTRAFAQMVEKFEKEGVPTGPLPDGTPNKFLPALKNMMDAMYDENLANGKTEIFIPPLSVIALGGGTTLPGRGIGKSY